MNNIPSYFRTTFLLLARAHHDHGAQQHNSLYEQEKREVCIMQATEDQGNTPLLPSTYMALLSQIMDDQQPWDSVMKPALPAPAVKNPAGSASTPHTTNSATRTRNSA